MMMKIFGAVLIISGGYLIGRVRTLQWNRRLKALNEVAELFREFDRSLREYRLSLSEALQNKGETADCILAGKPVRGLQAEDIRRLESTACQLRIGSFQDSVAVNHAFLTYLESTITTLQEEIASSGKALPLVTGAIGLLIAVFLF